MLRPQPYRLATNSTTSRRFGTGWPRTAQHPARFFRVLWPTSIGWPRKAFPSPGRRVRVKPGARAPSLPADPDVKVSLIRFLGVARFHTTGLQATPQPASPASIRRPKPTVHLGTCETDTGSKSRAAIAIDMKGDTRLLLRYTRSHGWRWFPGLPAERLRTQTPARLAKPCGHMRLRASWSFVLPSLL